MNVILHEGDNREHLRAMIARGEFVHSVCCDPPYGLKSIIKRFGKDGSAPAKYHRDGAFARASKGFMGQKWDGSDIENDPEFWKLVKDVMLPGAYLVAFSSPRTYHLMTTAIEMAGFVIHPMIGWCYGSGMPKAHRTHVPGFEGWRHGGQARKPALEPICIAQKPFSEKTAKLNIIVHGVGAVNIDDCRVEGGRWPANLITDGSAEVERLFPEAVGAIAPVKGTEPSSITKDIYGKFSKRVPGQFYGDQSGSAMRFFEQYRPLCYECGDSGVKYTEMQCIGDSPSLELCPYCDGQSLDPTPFEDDPLLYVPKANKQDRAGSSHPTVKPISLIRSLIRHVTPPGGTVLDPFAGSGTTGQAARDENVSAILMEMEKPYASFIRRRLDLPLTADDLLGEVPDSPTYEDLL